VADTGRPHGGASDLAEVLTVVCRKGVAAPEMAARKGMGGEPRTAMMTAAEMREAVAAAEMTAAKVTPAEVAATEVTTATEMSPAVTAATEMSASPVTTTSAASAQRRAR
jgi:hypothetical protein